jgi:hypothetical protein
MRNLIFPGRRVARALLVPAAGLALVTGVMPVSAATTHGTQGRAAVASLRALVTQPWTKLGRPTASDELITLGGEATVKTSNGQTWTMGVGDDNDSGGLSIGLERGVISGTSESKTTCGRSPPRRPA